MDGLSQIIIGSLSMNKSMNYQKDLLRKEMIRHVESEDGIEYIDKHLSRFAQTIQLIPKFGSLKVLDLGSFAPLAAYLKKITKHHYTYHGIWKGSKTKKIKIGKQVFTLHNFDLEKERFPFTDKKFDFVICGEILEHLGLDPMFMISEINRVLKNNGALLLTTPNVTSLRNLSKMLIEQSPYLYASFTLSHDRHNREYSPVEVKMLLEYGGFKLEKLYTYNTYFKETRIEGLKFSIRMLLKTILWIGNFGIKRGDCIFVLAHKIEKVRERYPTEFYDINRQKMF